MFGAKGGPMVLTVDEQIKPESLLTLGGVIV